MKFSYSNRSESRGGSWEKGPELRPEPLEVIEADVVVVGAGAAGLTAAVRCAQLGLSVAVAEKRAARVPHGNYIGVVPEGVDKKIFAKRWLRATGSRIDEVLLWKFIDRSAAALDWLVGLSEGHATAVLCENRLINPDIGAFPGDYYLLPKGDKYASQGGELLCEILEDALTRLGGRIYSPVTANYLEKDESGRVVSFIATAAGGETCRFMGRKAVVLAAGDCGGDEEMLDLLSPVSLKAGKNLSLNTGDGQKMAYWAGAELDGLYWAPNFGCEAYGPYTFFFTAVNKDGRRFSNEDTSEVARARHCMNQRGGDCAYTICDDKWFEELEAARGVAGGPAIMPERGLTKAEIETMFGENMFKAETLAGLAMKIGVPADELEATAARVNELAAKGEDVDYGKRPELLTTIEKAPFYAFKWGPTLRCTYGGAVVDEDMKVNDPDDRPIPGLYAVGANMGGFFAVTYPSALAGSGFGSALTFGIEAAEAIAKE